MNINKQYKQYLYLPEFTLVTGPFGNGPGGLLPPGFRAGRGRRRRGGSVMVTVSSRSRKGRRVHDGMVWGGWKGELAGGRIAMHPSRPYDSP